jgi:hypothetical protein
LIQAHREMQNYQSDMERHAARKEELAKLREQHQQDDEAYGERVAEQFEAERQRQKSEEQALFDAIKSDAIAVNLLKAFVLLRDERSHFETRLQEADETMYSIEDRWTRKATELRRQADEFQRRAEDERHRLESDLDDAEAKLKKVERGW